MIQTQEALSTLALDKEIVSKNTKLSSTIIRGEGDYPIEGDDILQSVEDTVGIYHSVAVSIRKGEYIQVVIESDGEILEEKGLMQTTVFNVQKTLCQEFGVRITSVQNKYVPEYA